MTRWLLVLGLTLTAAGCSSPEVKVQERMERLWKQDSRHLPAEEALKLKATFERAGKAYFRDPAATYHLSGFDVMDRLCGVVKGQSGEFFVTYSRDFYHAQHIDDLKPADIVCPRILASHRHRAASLTNASWTIPAAPPGYSSMKALNAEIAAERAASREKERDALLMADQARRDLQGLLRDPESAEFRDQRTGPKGANCGLVNSKNGFGAMTGFQRYVALGGAAVVLEEEVGSAAMNRVWSDHC